MRFKTTYLLISVLIFSVAAFGQKTPVADQIKLMDRQWIIEAYSSRDLADFDRIVAEDFLITSSNGKVQTKAEKRTNVKNDYSDPSNATPADNIFRIEPDSHQVRVFNKTAVSHGYITEKYVWKGTPINNHVHFTNVYVKRNGKWQVVAAQFTKIKQT